MTNILSAAEAANVLRVDTDNPDMLALLPIVDTYIANATGRNWAADATIHDTAKAAARILLVMWHENPGMVNATDMPVHGLSATLAQLEALALRYKNFAGRTGAGGISLPGARLGDSVDALTGLIGASGDQTAAFETVITVADEIQQVSTADLSENWYRAHLKPLSEL